jgi:ribosome recycling factor
MTDSILQSHTQHFDGVISRLHEELTSIRTGRANVGLLATVIVESYGSKMPLQQVASVTVSDAKTLTISPWDKGLMGAIEKGIQAANLGLTPGNDGSVIRINIPPMTEDRRKEMVKTVSQIGEQARIGIRQVREDAVKAMKRAKDDNQIGEDDLSAGQKRLQDMVDKYNAQVKEIITDKEKEIMTV